MSWLTNYLRDPWGAIHHLLIHLRDLTIMWGPIAGPVTTAIVLGLVLARRQWRRHYHQQLATNARLITVLAPPTVDPTGAVTLWTNLIGLLRPAWARRLGHQPHLAFEFVFTTDGVQIHLWVPGPVPPGMIERAIEAAWLSLATIMGPV